MDVCKVQYVSFFLNSGIQKKSLVPQQYLLPDLFKFMHFKSIIFSKYGKQRLKKNWELQVYKPFPGYWKLEMMNDYTKLFWKETLKKDF